MADYRKGRRDECGYRVEKEDGRAVPDLRPSEPRVVCVVASDLHLSDNPPVSRGDPDWYEAMARPLRAIKRLKEKYACPLLLAGDIFHKWNVSPRLINFAMDEVPRNALAIPGQHDLPHHRYEDIEASAYWTLVKAYVISNLTPGEKLAIDGVAIYPFPWGYPVQPPEGQPLEGFNLALVHSYVWHKEYGYEGAPPSQHLSKHMGYLKGYRAAVFGDNHRGFLAKGEKCNILNCGGLMRRNSDEADYQPRVGLVWSDGDITRVKLDTSEDVLLTREQAIAKVIEKTGSFNEFLEAVKGIGNCSANFLEAIKEAVETRKPSVVVRDLVFRATEPKK